MATHRYKQKIIDVADLNLIQANLLKKIQVYYEIYQLDTNNIIISIKIN